MNIVNKRNNLSTMVEDIDPHIIEITESWVTTDISDAELGMTGYVMFRKDRFSFYSERNRKILYKNNFYKEDIRT